MTIQTLFFLKEIMFLSTDPCQDNPCVNGTCIPNGNDYSCQCHAVCGCAAAFTTKKCTSGKLFILVNTQFQENAHHPIDHLADGNNTKQ